MGLMKQIQILNGERIILFISMSNLANYSPYNKTFKFLLFQNQAYHQRNKRNAKPCVRTNLRYAKSCNQSFHNPEVNRSDMYNVQKVEEDSENRCSSPSNSVARSMIFTSRSLRESNPLIHKPRRVVHKHQSFEKFQNIKIQKDNSKLVNRIISTSCHVIKRQKSLKSFHNHLKYREIRNKYDSAGCRKHALVVGDSSLLCPTLKQYNQSGLASKFIEQNLSWSKSSTQKNARLRRESNNFSKG